MAKVVRQDSIFHVRLSRELRSQIDRTAERLNVRASETARIAMAIGLKQINADPQKPVTTKK